jgi:hypothetical protein
VRKGSRQGLLLRAGLSAPRGRLTGIFSQVADLTANRLEILKEMVPRLHRALVFCNPDNASAVVILGMVPLPLTFAVAVECSTAINRLPD